MNNRFKIHDANPNLIVDTLNHVVINDKGIKQQVAILNMFDKTPPDDMILFSNQTSQGDKVLDILTDDWGDKIAVVEQKSGFTVGLRYNLYNGCWGQGVYGFSSHEEALQFAKSKRSKNGKFSRRNGK